MREDDPAEPPRWNRPAHRGSDRSGRLEPRGPERSRTRPVSASDGRLHLPVLQPRADPHRGGERRAADAAREERPLRSCEADERTLGTGRDDEARRPPARRAEWRRAATDRSQRRAREQSAALLLADEPTGELDTKTGQEILDLFRRLNQEFKKTIVVVTHDARVSHIAHRILEIQDGKIMGETAAA